MALILAVLGVPHTGNSRDMTVGDLQASTKVVLNAKWDTPMQGGNRTHRDLSAVLNGFASPSDDLTSGARIEIFGGVTYLMPLEEALKQLNVTKRPQSVKRVVCPGFPRDTLNYSSFDGLFDGHYNRLDVVTDAADQVVTLQLVDEHPNDKVVVSSRSLQGDWLTYNFVGYRVKAITYMKVNYTAEYRFERTQRWLTPNVASSGRGIGEAQLLRVDSELVNKDQRRMEAVRWFVPKPFASLILHCIGKAQ